MITSILIKNPPADKFNDAAVQSIQNQTLKPTLLEYSNQNNKDVLVILKEILPSITTPYFSVLLNNGFYYTSKLEKCIERMNLLQQISMVYNDFEVLSIANGQSVRNFSHPYDIQLYLAGYVPTINSVFRTEYVKKVKLESCKTYHDLILNLCQSAIMLHIPEVLHCERTNDSITT